MSRLFSLPRRRLLAALSGAGILAVLPALTAIPIPALDSANFWAVKVKDGRVFHACADGALHVLDLDSGERVISLTGHRAPVSCFDLLGEDHVVTGSFDKTARIFDLRSGECLAVVEGHTHVIWDIAVIDAQHFVTASDDDQARRFHVDWELAPPDEWS